MTPPKAIGTKAVNGMTLYRLRTKTFMQKLRASAETDGSVRKRLASKPRGEYAPKATKDEYKAQRSKNDKIFRQYYGALKKEYPNLWKSVCDEVTLTRTDRNSESVKNKNKQRPELTSVGVQTDAELWTPPPVPFDLDISTWGHEPSVISPSLTDIADLPPLTSLDDIRLSDPEFDF